MWEVIKDKLISGTYDLLFFLGGVLLGVITVLTVCAIIRKTHKKTNKGKKTLSVSEIAEAHSAEFLNEKTGFDFKSKLQNFFVGLNDVNADVCKIYYPDGVFSLTFFQGSELIPNGINAPLDFNLYELLGFIDSALVSVQTSLEKTLQNKEFTFAYTAYRFINKTIDKDPKKVKLAYIIEILTTPKKPETSVVKKIIGKVITPVIKTGLAIVEPSVSAVVDNFFVDVLCGVTEDLNLLYSRNLSCGISGLIDFSPEKSIKGEK